MPHVDAVLVETLARPLSRLAGQDDGVLVVGQDVVELELEAAAGQLEDLAEERGDLGVALVVARQRAAARDVPDDVLVEDAEDGVEVPLGEGLVAPP